MKPKSGIVVSVALVGLRLCGVENDPAVAAELQKLLAKHGVPALAAAIVTSAGMDACAVAGMRKCGAPEQVTVADLWHLGSDTKAMTAALVGRLVEEGTLTWDTRVAEVFPELAPSFHPDVSAVTMRQLLAHRGGLKANLDWSAMAKAGGSVTDQRLRAVREGLAAKPEAACGARTLYSNLGYVIAGAVIERRTGIAWEEAIAARVFRPLGMASAGYGGVGTPGRVDQPWPHPKSGAPAASNGPSVDNPPVLGPAGRVHCSMEDWARFVVDQLRGAQGLPGLLKAETYREMQSPVEGGDFALGWAVTERSWGGGAVLTHGGCNTMNYAIAWLAPRRDFAVLVCCNQGDDAAAQACDAAASALIARHLREKAARLDALIGRAWDVTWKRFYLPETHLFYDYLTSYEPGRELSHLPTLDEVRRQYPNECGYGTGMEDGMISAGVMLSLITDRYAVTGEESLRARALEVFQGVRLCASAHGASGFLARAVSRHDLKSVYPNSSRDQYTHAVHGLWLYYHSPLCAAETQADIRAIVSAVADRMTRTVTSENDYDSLRIDGSRDTRGISRMWNVKGHEAARLPMLYAIAWDLTGRQDYYDLYRKYAAPAVEQSQTVEARQPTYAWLQMQASLDVLASLEKDAVLKDRLRRLQAMVSERCAERARQADLAAPNLDLTMLGSDWRTGEGLSIKGRYRQAWYNIRESGEAALTQLMDSNTPFSEEQQTLLARAIMRLDYDRVSSCGIFDLQAAYWKARRRGLYGR